MRIAILTRLPSYFSEQRLSEEGKKRGHDVVLVQYPKCYINLDPSKPEVRYEGEALDQIDVLIPRLTASSITYGAAIARQLEVMGAYTTASSIAISRAFDRLRALQVLSRAGVEIPKTAFSRETDQWDDLLSRFNFPVIIRSTSSVQGSGPVLAESAKAAIALMRALSTSTAFMVQERAVAESVDITAMVVGQKVVASLQQDSLVTKTVKKPAGGTKAVPIKLTADESKVVLKTAKALGLTVCSVQLIRSAQGLYVIGADATPSLEMFEKATKRNIAEKIIEYIEVNAKRRNKKDRVGA